MSWATWIGIYVVLWWTVLFAVLPFGVRSQEEHGEVVPGSEPGAPALPRLATKALWTTVATGVVFLTFFVAYSLNFIDLERFGTLWGLFPR